ncbi:universal stress protein [Aquimarina sp. SS2-1]|uniref:universal stress protein n=1 Tax=Aquimarina besae TaxID=3342247 RepID=UPI00366BAC6B
MQYILIPIDFSDHSYNALAYARLVFHNEKCTFILLYVYVSHPSNLLNDEYSEGFLTKMSDEREEDLMFKIDEIEKENKNPNHQFEGLCKIDSLINAIKGIVISKEIDYIVMGTKGASGIKEIFLGSNTVKTINEIDNCPILVVPNGYNPKKPSLIAFSTNFNRTFFKREVDPFLSIVKSNGSKIHITRIMQEKYLTDKQKTNQETLKTIFNEFNFTFTKIDVETSETEALKDFARQTECDLIALVHHKYNFFQKLVEEDVVDKISFSSPVPLLILPELHIL